MFDNSSAGYRAHILSRIFQRRDGLGKELAMQFIVIIQEYDILSFGFFRSSVSRGAYDAAIMGDFDVSDGRIFFYRFFGGIRRAVVYDNNLIIRKILRQCAFQRPLLEDFLSVEGCYDTA